MKSIRSAVNSFGAWLDSGQDSFDELVRITAFVAVGVGVLLVVVIFFILIFGNTEPSLFCRDGSVLQSQPATQVVGKVPVSGVRFTCR